MSTSNPYRTLVDGYVELLRRGADLPLGGLTSPQRPRPAPDAPRVLIFAPHPDDECIIAGLPLRLQQESNWSIINVAVTQGSRKDRRAARWRELSEACAYLGFDLLATAEGGLDRIHPQARRDEPGHWRAAVEVIAAIITEQQPRVVMMPHEDDWNRTHIGTHHLVRDALARQPAGFSCHVVETEFWGAMAAPDLLVESTDDDVATMIGALSFHRGEVERNPYHLRLPAWLIDNVRRGAELVGGQGEAAPGMSFATLYRLRRWAAGGLHPVHDGGRILAVGDDPAQLFI